MSDKDKLEIIFKFLVLILLAIVVIMSFKLANVYARLNKLEKDYKIYEINLENLKKNKSVQFKGEA